MAESSCHGLPIIVAHYDLQGHPRLTEHWNLAILASHQTVHIFEVRGNSDSFTYMPELNIASPLNQMSNYRGGCHVGYMPADSVERIREKLRDVPVVKYGSYWDGQIWCMNAIKLLKEEGYIFPKMNEPHVRKELAEDMERWQQAEDTIDERLLARK
ncbi:hypothetical protein BDQ12DRAFT_693388 [Crucibulum laeve]|uniref:Uncharacterized protein n=1 Tax=Crucibulum laeve TaxID=68775 RepID=A0A5C3LGW8_9AGAR|nr:hypothetical protein BDQ12DRAFT_693388 [Crucibulum laeve]